MTPARLLLVSAFLLTSGVLAQHSHGAHAAAPMTMQAMNEADLNTLRPLSGRAFDIKFAQLMMNHHRMAVDMAQYAFKNGQDARVRQNAQAVMNVQTREIAQMQSWLRAWKAAAPKQEQTSLSGIKGSADRWFLTEMIPHHQGALDMAKLAQTCSKNKDVLNLAAAILNTQQAEINQYRAWLKVVK